MSVTAKAKGQRRERRHGRIRARVHGSTERPRLSVFRSNRYLTAQIINDDEGRTIIGLSSRAIGNGDTFSERAKKLGMQVAEAAKQKGVGKVVFDRGGYQYTGNIKVFADAVREGGLQF